MSQTGVIHFPVAGALERRRERTRLDRDLQEQAYLDTQLYIQRLAAEIAAGNERTRAKYNVQLELLQQQAERLARAEERLERLEGLEADEQDWRTQRAALREELLAQYGDLGGQYALLVDRAVDAELRARRLEASGLQLAATDWRAIGRAVQEAVQALQKYTESQKTEIIAERVRTETLELVVPLFERVLSTRAPEAWLIAVEELQKALPKGREGA